MIDTRDRYDMIIATIVAYLAYARNSLDTLFSFLHEIDDELSRTNWFRVIEK